VAFDDATPLVADLADVVKSKRAAGRPRDIAVVKVSSRKRSMKKRVTRKMKLEALKKESDRALRD
jgi:hypothetical protein